MTLPSSIRVIVRGWLNCNQVVLRAPGDNVLVDSGYCTHRERTLELVAGPAGLAGEPLERLVNTHCHSDHMGGNAAIASAYGCRVIIPEGEVKHVDPWTPQSVWMAHFDQKADPFRFDATLRAGDAFEGGGFEWQAHAAPGHDMDALMFFEPRNRILVSGDALWENGMGHVWPEHGDNRSIAAAHETLSAIEALAPAVVIPGHGKPFTDLRGTVRNVRARLEAFRRDPARNARSVAKAMFAFALLDRREMALADVPAYLDAVPCYRDLAENFIGRPPRELGPWLVDELQRAGAIGVAEGIIRPVGSA
jgi:glyoxylase-like metal-dependent hydrolase (beta-lactamase superfamily II)